MSETPEGSSSWKPNLRRIKHGLFSSKGEEKGQREEHHTLTARSGNERSQKRWVNGTWVSPQADDTMIPRNTGIRILSPKSMDPPRERPKGPRQLKDSKGFNFLKRPLTKSKSQSNLMDRGSVGSIASLLPPEMDGKEEFDIRPMTAAYILTHTASDFSKVAEQRKPKLPDETSTKSKSLPYVQQHAASDFRRLAEQRKPELLTGPVKKPKPAPYVPHHAASDFSKLNVKAPVDLPPPLRDDESNDYQMFLAASRMAAARTFNSSGILSPNKLVPQTTDAMNRAPNNHRAMVDTTDSSSQHSTSSRPVSRGESGSLFDRVGEYTKNKPGRPGSISTERTASTSIGDRKSLAPSVGLQEKGSGSRLSTIVNGSIRSVSLGDNNEDGDGRAARRRKRRMPTSPGLKKFNKVVDSGQGLLTNGKFEQR